MTAEDDRVSTSNSHCEPTFDSPDSALAKPGNRGGRRLALRTFRMAGLALLAALAACSDPTAPAGKPASTPSTPHPDVLIDWYNCVSMDSGYNWTCEYTHTEWQSTGGGPWVPNAGTINNVPSNCQTNPAYCENFYHTGGGDAGGGSSNPVPAAEENEHGSKWLLHRYRRLFSAGERRSPRRRRLLRLRRTQRIVHSR